MRGEADVGREAGRGERENTAAAWEHRKSWAVTWGRSLRDGEIQGAAGPSSSSSNISGSRSPADAQAEGLRLGQGCGPGEWPFLDSRLASSWELFQAHSAP